MKLSTFSYLLFLILTFNYSLVYSDSLKNIINDAINFYPEIEKSNQNIMIKSIENKISKNDFLPSLDLTLSHGKSITKSNPDLNDYNFNTLNPSNMDINLVQPLGTTKYINLKESENLLEIAKLEHKNIIQNIIHRAAISYYNVLKSRFLLDVAIKNENNLARKLKETNKSFNLKNATNTDLFQSKSRLSIAKSKTIEGKNNLEMSISEFRSIIGRDPDINWFSVDEKTVLSSNPKDWSKFGSLPKLPDNIEMTKKIASKENFFLRINKYKIKNMDLDLKKKTLNFFPEVSITGTFSKKLENTRTINQKNTYEIFANMSLPLFSKGQNIYNIEKSKNEALLLNNEIEKQKIELINKINKSWNKYESLKSSIEFLVDSIESNEIALTGVTNEAKEKKRTVLDILDAEKELTESEANLINQRFNLINVSFDILKLCGLLNTDYLFSKR